MFLKEVEKPSYCVCSKENEACKVGDLGMAVWLRVK